MSKQENDIEYGHVTIRKGYFGSEQVSERVEVGKSFELKDYYDLQSQVMQFIKLIQRRETRRLSMEVTTHETGSPKRLKVTWLKSQTGA